MSKKITGFFYPVGNDNPIAYENLIPDDVYTDFDIESVECNGMKLNIGTITVTSIDDYPYETLKRACLFQSLLEHGVLDDLLNYMEMVGNSGPEGRVLKIWFNAMQTLTRTHSKALMIQAAMQWTDEQVKAFWIRGEEIKNNDI